MELDIPDCRVKTKLQRIGGGDKFRFTLEAPRDLDCWRRLFDTLRGLFPYPDEPEGRLSSEAADVPS